MIKDYVINSFHIEKEDFYLNPFNAQGGLGKMCQLFGDKTEEIIGELNEALARSFDFAQLPNCVRTVDAIKHGLDI